eukprot:9971760-Alexandrium_andersonii.AAC.1
MDWLSSPTLEACLQCKPRPHTYHGIAKQAKGQKYKGPGKPKAKGKAKAGGAKAKSSEVGGAKAKGKANTIDEAEKKR